jgi:excisionase family DNA binding protein
MLSLVRQETALVNLKQAARRLGVHYQTAYKLVRSGRLAAVCVGARYEISDAAIERYLAERQAMRRTPVRASIAASQSERPGGVFGAATAALDAAVASGPAVMELVADALASEVGDLAVVRELAYDRQRFLPAVVRHPDPARRATVAATVGAQALDVHGSRVLGPVAQGETILKPLVPQDCVRSRLPAEAVEHFEEAGIHSMIVAPARHAGHVLGLVAVTRDAPGHPYGRAAVDVVEHAGLIVGTAIARARLTAASWARRRALVDGVANVVEHGDNPAPVHTLLESGPIAEFVCDPSGRILTANPTAGRLLEVDGCELVGRSLPELFGPAREQHVSVLERMVRGEFAYADLRADLAATHRLAVAFAVVRDAQAQPRALVAVAHELPRV